MKNLEKELLEQIRLMNYDRSKILSEQKTKPEYNLKQSPIEINKNDPRFQFRGGEFKPYTSEKTPRLLMTDTEKKEEDNSIAKRAYDIIVKEIEGGWAPWKWGTDEDGITDAILSIENLQQYQILRNLLAKKYPKSAYPNTLLGFIQQEEFSTAQDQFTNDMVRNSQLPLGAIYQYETNDKYLREMQKHLSKFNKDEVFQSTGSVFDPKTKALNMVLPPAASDAAHMALPALAVMTMWAPPLSLAFEGLDASLYLAEGRYYEAGLAAAFILIPGGPLAQTYKSFTSAERKVVAELMEREAKGEVVTYTAKQKKLVQEFTKKSTQKQLAKKLVIEGLKKEIKDIMSITMMHRLIYYMVSKGYLPLKFLTTMGLTIGSVFYTWDAIAKGLGVCNPAPLKALLEADKEWMKKIGQLGVILQPFSDPCVQEDVIKVLLSEKKEGTKGIILARLKFIENQQNILILSDENYSKIESLETMSVQIALTALGYTKFTEVKSVISKEPYYEPILNEPEIDYKTNSGAGMYNNYDPSGGIGRARAQTTGLSSTGSIKSDKAATQKLVYRDVPKEEKKVVDVKFKWGYYDYNTDMAVREFQKKNGLSVDGSVGVNTAKKLWEKVNGLSSVSNYGTKVDDYSDKDIERLKQELTKKINELESQKTPPVNILNQPPTKEQKEKLIKEIEQNVTEDVIEMDPSWKELNY